MPLTPWTRIHRACHGFIDNSGGYISDRYGVIQRECYEEMGHALEDAYFSLKRPDFLFDFKSAKHMHDSGVGIQMELYREILTDYIWNGGKVRVSNNGERMFPGLSEKVNAACHAILSKYVGRILIEQVDFL